ncbi:MAG: hypothetical protein ABEH43_06520, partial [Flavobacteriales bacterium]
SYINSKYDKWPNSLKNTFSDLGADSIGVAQDGVPFLFFAQKGDTSSAVEVYGQNKNDVLSTSIDVQVNAQKGSMKSDIIGPASSWESLNWDFNENNYQIRDKGTIEVYGIDHGGKRSSLYKIPITTNDSSFNLQSVNTTDYPFLQLNAEIKDDSLRTPLQQDSWRVLFQPEPEAAINPKKGYYLSKDSIQQGQNIEFSAGIENISEQDMDSLLVSYWIQTLDNRKKKITFKRNEPLLSNEVIHDTASLPTTGVKNKNFVWMEANPRKPDMDAFDQPEKHHFNNFALKQFHVQGDKTNPVLDVTFDGVHILDGDIVSPTPEIMITLNDENKFRLMDEISDTSHFKVWLTNPQGKRKKVPFKDNKAEEMMKFIPASSKKNRFKILYRPEFEKEGIYQLRVQAEDKAGNPAGDIDYKIRFEVIKEMTVTNFMNYPNPFSTRTQFIFTLTGNEIPDNILIRIMTVTGKVVREITKEELGPLRIGRNKTDFWWDGTDKYGDKLANGVYLYKVIVKDDNDKVKKRKTGTDKYFKKGYGKMYLMR